MRVGEAGSVPVAMGDALLRGVGPDFLKIDVEGMELRVLRGLRKTIGRRRPAIFIEVDVRNADAVTNWIDVHRYAIAARFKRYPANENLMLLPRPAED